MHTVTSTLVLANAARTIGIVLGVLLLLAFAIAILFNMRKGRAEVGSEIELAANRKPYLDDDELETKKLDRTLGAGLVILAVIGIAFRSTGSQNPAARPTPSAPSRKKRSSAARTSTSMAPSARTVMVRTASVVRPTTRSPIPQRAIMSRQCRGEPRRSIP